MSDTPTDSELLRDAGHDPHAFRMLYDRWAKPLLAFCYRRTCDLEASLDLVAETFAIAYQKRHRYRDRGRGVGAWLYGIAARELAAYRRRQRVELRACRRLAVTVPPLDDTSLERIEELVDAGRWRAALGQALRRRGLNVGIQFIPASPSLVDKQVASYETPGGDRRVRWTYHQASSVEQDLVTVRVPLDYSGELGMAIGRRVRPGEHYESAALSAQLPGEALHCADVEGRRIRDILPPLQQRHLRARWHITTPTGRLVPLERVIDWYVDGTTPWAPGEVMISAVPQQPDRSRLDPDHLALMRRGCPG